MQQIKKGLIFFFRKGERGVTLATYSNEPELCGVGVVQSSISDTQRLEPTANDDGGWWTFSKGTVKKQQQQQARHHTNSSQHKKGTGRKNQLKQQRTEQSNCAALLLDNYFAAGSIFLCYRVKLSAVCAVGRARGRCFCSRFTVQAASAGWTKTKSFFFFDGVRRIRV